MESTSNHQTLPINKGATTEIKKRKKPCCVCKSTKRLRDSCIRNNDEEACFDFIKAHRLCLASKGFNIV